jgi:YHS domain-containing protein
MLDRPERPVRAAVPLRLSRLVPLLLALIATPHIAPAAEPIPRIAWRTQYESAESEARASGRRLWLQFTGSWCVFCRKMDSEVFPRPEVASLARQAFIPVKVDSEERDDLLARFAVGGLPCTILLEPGGRELARIEGYAEPDEFLAFLAARRPEPTAEVALAGFDPVLLLAGSGLAPGQPTLTAHYDGQEFRFADEADRAAFLRDPERYVPACRGLCPVELVDASRREAGHPRFGVYYRGRLYVCSGEEARRRFAANPDRYADADLADNGHCPHCRALAGRPVPGDPQYSAIYRGRRYLFPDPEHREAFRTTPERYLR